MCVEVGRVRVDEARDRLQTKTKLGDRRSTLREGTMLCIVKQRTEKLLEVFEYASF